MPKSLETLSAAYAGARSIPTKHTSVSPVRFTR
jgi:hypothetical protein